LQLTEKVIVITDGHFDGRSRRLLGNQHKMRDDVSDNFGDECAPDRGDAP
jgi:hypothetical protein